MRRVGGPHLKDVKLVKVDRKTTSKMTSSVERTPTSKSKEHPPPQELSKHHAVTMDKCQRVLVFPQAGLCTTPGRGTSDPFFQCQGNLSTEALYRARLCLSRACFRQFSRSYIHTYTHTHPCMTSICWSEGNMKGHIKSFQLCCSTSPPSMPKAVALSKTSESLAVISAPTTCHRLPPAGRACGVLLFPVVKSISFKTNRGK